MKEYFIIHCSEDGISVDNVDREKLLERIKPDSDDENNFYGTNGFLDHIPGDWDNEDNKDKLLIIKGEIVIPSEKEVVKSFDVK